MSTIYRFSNQAIRGWIPTIQWNWITKSACALAVTGLVIVLFQKFMRNSGKAPNLNHRPQNLALQNQVLSAGDSITLRTYNLPNYIEKIELTAPGELLITQGSERTISLIAETRIIDLLTPKTSNMQRHLILGTSGSFETHEKITYKLVIPSLSELKVSGNGFVKISNLETDKWKCGISGNGKVIIAEGEVYFQKIELEDNGYYDAAFLTSTMARVIQRGISKSSVNVSEKLQIDLYEGSHCYYRGSPKIDASAQSIAKLERVVDSH